MYIHVRTVVYSICSSIGTKEDCFKRNSSAEAVWEKTESHREKRRGNVHSTPGDVTSPAKERVCVEGGMYECPCVQQWVSVTCIYMCMYIVGR